MNLNTSLSLTYAILWPIMPRKYRMYACIAPIIALSTPPLSTSIENSYPWTIVLLNTIVEVILSLFYEARHDTLHVAHTAAPIAIFLHIKIRQIQDSELLDDGSLKLHDIMYQIALYGSFIAWCILTFSYARNADMNESWFQATALALCSSVTLYQIPVHLKSTVWNTTTQGLITFVLEPYPVVSISLISISLAMQWFPGFGLDFILYVTIVACLPVLAALIIGIEYWWDIRRYVETVVWMMLTIPSTNIMNQQHQTEELVLAVVGFGFAASYFIAFFVMQYSNFMELATDKTESI
jgi:hypothetical protein